MRDEQILGPRDMRCDYNVLDEPKQIPKPGGHILMGTDTGLLPGLLTDNNDVLHRIGLRCLILPLGRNLFSPLNASQLGVCTIIEEGNLHLRYKKGLADFMVPCSSCWRICERTQGLLCGMIYERDAQGQSEFGRRYR